MDYEVQLGFKNINCEEISDYGVDHVKLTEALGCKAFRVFEPKEIAPTIEKARRLAEQLKVPVLVEIITERITDIAMGPEIDQIKEFEETLDLPLAEEVGAAV